MGRRDDMCFLGGFASWGNRSVVTRGLPRRRKGEEGVRLLPKGQEALAVSYQLPG